MSWLSFATVRCCTTADIHPALQETDDVETCDLHSIGANMTWSKTWSLELGAQAGIYNILFRIRRSAGVCTFYPT